MSDPPPPIVVAAFVAWLAVIVAILWRAAGRDTDQ